MISNKSDNEKYFMDINQIKEILPHRYPFLLVDAVIDYKKNEFLIATKNVSINEEVFQGHFPNRPIYPGVLVVEGIAQSGALYVCLLHNIKNSNLPVSFMSIDKCKFRKPVIPGDTLKFLIEPINIKETIAKLNGKAYVKDKLVAEMIITAMIGV